MRFMNILNEMLAIYDENKCQKHPIFTLYGVHKQSPPLADHYIFDAMPQKIMDHLVDSYELPFPKELLTIYRSLNGCALFWNTVYIEKFKISVPLCNFAIYGVPFGVNENMIEPWNISVEDLNRPPNTPPNWLKFGAYYNQEHERKKFDLFVDTESHRVYSVENGIKDCVTSEEWDDMDSCLCEILERMK